MDPFRELFLKEKNWLSESKFCTLRVAPIEEGGGGGVGGGKIFQDQMLSPNPWIYLYTYICPQCYNWKVLLYVVLMSLLLA